jgi:hypothetical protein
MKYHAPISRSRHGNVIFIVALIQYNGNETPPYVFQPPHDGGRDVVDTSLSHQDLTMLATVLVHVAMNIVESKAKR